MALEVWLLHKMELIFHIMCCMKICLFTSFVLIMTALTTLYLFFLRDFLCLCCGFAVCQEHS